MRDSITIKGNLADGFYWHYTPVGAPGEQSDKFPTVDEAINDANKNYPTVHIYDETQPDATRHMRNNIDESALEQARQYLNFRNTPTTIAEVSNAMNIPQHLIKEAIFASKKEDDKVMRITARFVPSYASEPNPDYDATIDCNPDLPGDALSEVTSNCVAKAFQQNEEIDGASIVLKFQEVKASKKIVPTKGS